MDVLQKIDAEILEHERALGELRDIRAQISPEATGPSVVPLPDFLSESLDFNWLIGGMVAENTIGFLAAEPGVGKSTLAAQMALCLGAGLPFIDHSILKPYPSLIVSAEGSRAAFRTRVDRARKTLGLGPEASRWFIQTNGYQDIRFGSPGFERLIAESGARFCVCDTVGYFLAGQDENDAATWKAKVMIPLRKIAEQYGVSLLLIHHLTKSSEYRQGAQRLRGTSAMVADADHVLLMDRVDGDITGALRTLTMAKQKYSQDGSVLTLRYSAIDALFYRQDGAPTSTPPPIEPSKPTNVKPAGLFDGGDTDNDAPW